MKALKKPNKSHLLERLRREADYHFKSNGLPRVVEFFESDSEIILLLSFFDGVQLDEFWGSIKKRNRLNFTIQILEKLERIFEVLNEKKIIHCDIKPSNIIVSGDQDNFEIHLIDFGLAYKQSSPEERSTLFPLGYAAPELLLNKLSIVDHRTDIYSLGTMIWRLFNGKLPLVHPNPSIFTNLQLTHPLPESGSLPKGVYPVLAKMCTKHTFKTVPNALDEKEVIESLKEGIENRYSNLSEVIDDLKKIKHLPNFYQRISRR